MQAVRVKSKKGFESAPGFVFTRQGSKKMTCSHRVAALYPEGIETQGAELVRFLGGQFEETYEGVGRGVGVEERSRPLLPHVCCVWLLLHEMLRNSLAAGPVGLY